MSLRDKLERIPRRPGVYLFKDTAGRVLYVGKARLLRDRVRSYFQAGRAADSGRMALVSETSDLDLVVTDTEMEALALENNLIKRHKPPHNVRLRDDKNHPYLKLTLSEEYPRLDLVRGAGEGDAYGGPYIPASLARKTASIVHRVFGVRSCSESLDGKRPRACLQYQINRCLAPCVRELCSLERYQESCADAALFLEGRAAVVVERLRRQMKDAAEAERFEEAAVLRDQVLALKRVETPQKITTTENRERDLFAACVDDGRAALQVFSVRGGKVVAREGFLFESVADTERLLEATIQQFYAEGRYVPREVLVPEAPSERGLLEAWLAERRGGVVKIRVPRRGETLRLMDLVERNASLAFELEWKHPMRQSRELLRGLRDALALELEPRTIECFDISNIQGADIVASMVSFVEARPNKAGYRRFRVRTVSDGPDDFASMREVVGRRYARLLEEGGELPDLVLVDGGKGQLSAASDALHELGLGSQAVASLAKKQEQIFLRGQSLPIALPRSSPVLQLVQRIRDEAHRFAITYHRKRRRARTLTSELDSIPGVGPARRRRLLARFGSVPGRSQRERGRAGDLRRAAHGPTHPRPFRRGVTPAADPAGRATLVC